jgi:hypothetical protein
MLSTMSSTPDVSPLQLKLDALRNRLRRAVKRPMRLWWMAQLRNRNASGQASVVAPGGPVVSITTTRVRLQSIFYTLETIGSGRLKPSRLVLWIDQGLIDQGLPESLLRLQKRGLTIQGCRDVGPHTKFYPQVASEPNATTALVTADDDQLYPHDWLERLQRAYQQQPDIIHCYRASRMVLGSDGRLLPYKSWHPTQSVLPSALNFATGVSGIIYPPTMQAALARRGTAFIDCCPKADDVWLNAVALWERIPVRQIVPQQRNFAELPGSRQQGLARTNVDRGGNDPQIAATYRPEDLTYLMALQTANAAS